MIMDLNKIQGKNFINILKQKTFDFDKIIF